MTRRRLSESEIAEMEKHPYGPAAVEAHDRYWVEKGRETKAATAEVQNSVAAVAQ